MLSTFTIWLLYQVFLASNIHAKISGSIHKTNMQHSQSQCCLTSRTSDANYQIEKSKKPTLPFEVKGPKRLNDKIAIIGAGPSGIHMALMLKEKGFTNVLILERTDDLGGKSKTIRYRGAPQELGTVYLTPDYDDIIALLNKYVPNDLVDLVSASIWMDGLPGPITYKEYVAGFLMRLLGTNNQTFAAQTIFADICRYNALHHLLFGTYDQEIMPEPSAQV